MHRFLRNRLLISNFARLIGIYIIFAVLANRSLTLAVPTLISAQDSSSPAQSAAKERFRASTHLVTVDVVVTGKKANPVMDLKPHDFRIFEDDFPQILEFFQVDRAGEHKHVVVSAPGSAATDRTQNPQASSVDTFDNSHFVVLLLDYSTTTVANQNLVREGARKYITKTMNGQDQVAIFAFGAGLRALQSFTRDKQKLLAALDYSGSRGDAMAGEREALTQGASQAVDSQEKLTQQIGNLLGAAAAGAPGTKVVPALATAQAQLDMARFAELQFYALKSALDDQISRSVLLALQAVAEGLKILPGRKTVVLLSQGFVVPPNVRGILESALTASLRSNTAIYAIDSRGLLNDKPVFQTTELESISPLQHGTRTRVVNGESQFDRAALIGTDQEESLLRYLALSTGGLFLRNNNDLSLGLARVDKDIHARYLLAYTSTNKKMDGSFRNIRVEVAPKGLRVRARKGYYAVP